MDPVRKTTYVLHRAGGEREQGLSAEEVERRIRDGLLAEGDELSVLGGAPKPYWHFPRFSDLQAAAPVPRQATLPPVAAPRATLPPVQPSSVARPLSPSGGHRPPAPQRGSVPATGGRAAHLAPSGVVRPLAAPSAVLRALAAPDQAPEPAGDGALPWRAPRPFPDALMRLRPQALRARLLEALLQEVVGCGPAEPPDFALACARARLAQIDALMKPRWYEPAEVAAVTEVMGLISQACTLLAFPNLKERLLQREQELGRPAVLREVLSLALPIEDAFEQVSGKAPSSRQSASLLAANKRGAMSMITGAVMSVVGAGPTAGNGLSIPPAVFYERLTHMRIEDALGVLGTDGPERIAACTRERLKQVERSVAPLAQSSEDRELLHQIRCRLAQCFVVLAHPELSRVLRQRQARMGRQPTVAEAIDLAPAPGDALTLLAASDLRAALAALSASAILSKTNAASEERLRELEALMAAPPELTTEPLQWGTGDEEEGTRSIMVPLVTVLVAAAVLAFVVKTDANELLPELDNGLHYGRAFALLLAAYFSVRGVRFEAFSRFGWRPAAAWHWAIPLGGALAGAVLGSVLKGDPNPGRLHCGGLAAACRLRRALLRGSCGPHAAARRGTSREGHCRGRQHVGALHGAAGARRYGRHAGGLAGDRHLVAAGGAACERADVADAVGIDRDALSGAGLAGLLPHLVAQAT
jgi:hypothetical protein